MSKELNRSVVFDMIMVGMEFDGGKMIARIPPKLAIVKLIQNE